MCDTIILLRIKMRYRRTNLKTDIIDKLSLSTVDNSYIKNIIESDRATFLTIHLFYEELYLSFLHGSDKAKDKLRLLLIRIASRFSKFQALTCYGDTQKKETKRIEVEVNPKWLRALANKYLVIQKMSLNTRLQLSSGFSINGSLITWRSGVTVSTEYVHVDLKTPLGKLIHKFVISPNLTLSYGDYLGYAKNLGFDNENIVSILKIFINKKIIFLEFDRLNLKLEELLSLQINSNLKNELTEIKTQLDQLNQIPSLKDIKAIITKMNNLYKIDQPLILSNIENTPKIKSKSLNLPNRLKRLFSLNSVTTNDYKVGRAFKQYFQEKYGLFKFVPINEALKLTDFENLSSKLKFIEKHDNEYHLSISKWKKMWLSFLSKNGSKKSITITDDFIDKLSETLIGALDHDCPLKSYEFVYSYLEKENLFVLPTQAIFSKNSINTKHTKISTISYFPNVYPFFMNNPELFGKNLYINQYVPHNGYSEANLGFILLSNGLKFCDNEGHILDIEWNSIMETRVSEEEDTVDLLKSITNYINQVPFSALPPYFNKLHHIPQIKYKNICLSPETWNLNEHETDSYLEYWKNKKQNISVISQGNMMPFYQWHTNKTFNVIKTIQNTTFCETLLPQANYAIQFIKEEKLGLVNAINEKYKLFTNDKYQKFLHGFTLLLPNKDFDFYLEKLIQTFNKYDNWYFIRYFDNAKASIRIRLLNTEELISFSKELDKFSKDYGCEVIKKAYAIESNRFGATESMYEALQEFSCETKNYFILKNKLAPEINDTYKRVAIEENFLKCALLIINKHILLKIYSSKRENHYNKHKLLIDKAQLKYTAKIQFPDTLKRRITKCLKSKFENDSLNKFAYYYFSLIHLCQNRLLGSNENGEVLSREICKKILSHYL